VIVTIFLLVLMAAFAVLVFFTEPSRTDKMISARLVKLDQRINFDAPEEAGIAKEVTFSTIPAFDRFLRDNKYAQGLYLLIEQSDTKWTVGRFIFATLSIMILGAAVGNWWIAPGIVGWLPGLALGVVPYLFLRVKRARRISKFVAQLPAAIDLMARGLRAGQALASTIQTVAGESEDPLRTEFRRAADEQNFGLPFREALLNLNARVPTPDLQFLVTAVLVQKETGGNLAQVLDKAARVIRERERVEGQLRIRSAQGRLTGLMLCLLPFAIFIFMNFLSPGYGKVLFEEPTGRKMVIYAAIGMVLGILMIRRIVNIKV
jgi:tight adherence protein B